MALRRCTPVCTGYLPNGGGIRFTRICPRIGGATMVGMMPIVFVIGLSPRVRGHRRHRRLRAE